MQYHPEAAAGPHDALYLFERFTRRHDAERVAESTHEAAHASISSASAARRTGSTPRSCSASPSGAGFAHVDDADDAEVIVVNTCGFIGEAKKESIDTILEMAELKKSGALQEARRRRLPLAALPGRARARDARGRPLPRLERHAQARQRARRASAERMLVGNPADWVDRARAIRARSRRAARSAYVKIAEGCNRTCSFCVIPQLRGKQRSRADRRRRARGRAAGRRAACVEVNLVSQDTIAYGRDLRRTARDARRARARASPTCRACAGCALFYLYPEKLDDELIELLAQPPARRALRRHAAPARGRRACSRACAAATAASACARRRAPARRASRTSSFRTAFIVGHPGETDAEFDELCDFVRWAEFDRVGVFRYSDEETRASFALDDKVPDARRREPLPRS